ncbi:MAG: PKD domain-containing protein [Bacteroidota bacterium]
MKNYLLLLGLLVQTSLIAQISYTADDYANIGEQYIQSVVAIDSNFVVDFAQTGANFTWDYSDLAIASQEMSDFVDPDDSGYQSAFIFACVAEGNNIFTCNALWAELSNLAVRENGEADSPGISISDLYTFYRKNDQALEVTASGLTTDLNGLALPLIFSYDDVDTLFQFPIEYLNEEESTGRLVIEFGQPPNNLSFITNTQRRNVVEGYGSLKTPFGDFGATLKVKTTILQEDTISTNGITTPIPLTENVLYQWFSLDYGIPVLSAGGIVVGGFEFISNVRFVDSLRCLPPRATFLPNTGLNTQLDSSGIAEVFFFNLSQNDDEVSWDFGDGNGSQVGSPTHTYTEAGSYTVQLIACNTLSCDPEICDTSNLILNITDPFALEASFTVGGGPCANQDFLFEATANNADVFTWDFGDGNSAVGPTVNHSYAVPGIFTVTLEASNDLRTEIISQSVTVLPSFGNTFNITLCAGESITVPNGDVLDETGTYTYTYTAANGCDSVDTYVLDVLPGLLVSLGPDTTITINDTLVFSLSGFVDYQWSNGASGAELEITGEELGLGSHPLGIEVVDQFGCSATDTILITVNMATSTHETEVLSNAFTLAPNPTTGWIWVDISYSAIEPNAQLELFDLHGRMIQNQRAQFGQQVLDLSKIPAGVYWLQWRNGTSTVQKKIIKQ